jgi:integrase
MKVKLKSVAEFMNKNATSKNDLEGVDSLSTPSAQNTILCAPSSEVETLNLLSVEWLAKAKSYSLELWAILYLQIEQGLRISEVLQIEPKDILQNGNVKIRALKGGTEQIIATGEAKDFFKSRRIMKCKIFEGCSRFWVYREYKKLGVQFQSSQSSKKSVTHAPRHIKVANALASDIDVSLIASSIRQKNQNSTKKYGK